MTPLPDARRRQLFPTVLDSAAGEAQSSHLREAYATGTSFRTRKP